MLRAVRDHQVKSLIWNRNYLPAPDSDEGCYRQRCSRRIVRCALRLLFCQRCRPAEGKSFAGANQLARTATGGARGWFRRWRGRRAVGRAANRGCLSPSVFAHADGEHRCDACLPEPRRISTRPTSTTGWKTWLQSHSRWIGRLRGHYASAASAPPAILTSAKSRFVSWEARADWSSRKRAPEIAIYFRGQDPKAFKHRRVADDNNYLLMENFARALDEDGDTILDAGWARAISAPLCTRRFVPPKSTNPLKY